MKTVQEVYNYGKLANWDLIHQDRVDAIMLKHGFCAGLCYSLAVRANVFQCNTIHKGEDCFPNISKYREKIATETLHNSKSQKEIKYQENLYIEGGPREDMDPYTGKTKPNATLQANKGGRCNQGSQGNRSNCTHC